MKRKELIPIVDQWIAEHRDPLVQDLIRLVNIKSVAHPGEGGYAFGPGCAKVLEETLRLAREYGLEAENDDYFCGSAILRGSGTGEIAYVGHLDVVEEGEGWTYAPYDAIELDGHVIGRGAADCKGSCIAILYALRCLKELGLPLKHTVRALFGCQEESGMQDMVHFREVHKDPDLCLVVDCPFPIHHGEKGKFRAIMRRDISDGNVVQFRDGMHRSSTPSYAEMTITGHSLQAVRERLAGSDVEEIRESGDGITVSAKGVAGHPSFPEKDDSVNAIQKLAAIMAASGLLQGSAQEAVSFLAEAFHDFRGTGLGIAYEDELSGPTMVPQLGVEVENGVLRSYFQSRFGIQEDETWMYATLEKTLADHGFTVEYLEKAAPWFVPLDAMNGLPRRLVEISTELLEVGPLEPAILPAGTHAHMLKNSLGYGPTFLPGIADGKPKYGFAHGPNESVSIALLLRAMRVYILTVFEIDDEL